MRVRQVSYILETDPEFEQSGPWGYWRLRWVTSIFLFPLRIYKFKVSCTQPSYKCFCVRKVLLSHQNWKTFLPRGRNWPISVLINLLFSQKMIACSILHSKMFQNVGSDKWSFYRVKERHFHTKIRRLPPLGRRFCPFSYICSCLVRNHHLRRHSNAIHMAIFLSIPFYRAIPTGLSSMESPLGAYINSITHFWIPPTPLWRTHNKAAPPRPPNYVTLAHVPFPFFCSFSLFFYHKSKNNYRRAYCLTCQSIMRRKVLTPS